MGSDRVRCDDTANGCESWIRVSALGGGVTSEESVVLSLWMSEGVGL